MLDQYVLDALANDLEDIDHILVLLNSDSDFGWHREWGRPFVHGEIIESLRRLVRDSCVQVYVVAQDLTLTPLATTEWPADSAQGVWFGITEVGRLRHDEWDYHPEG